MKIVVLKFGGTSVGSTDRIKKVANIIISYVRKNYKVIVTSSAMSGVTNDLVKKSKSISNEFIPEEYDVLVSSGEQVSCSLIAGRLNHLGFKSRSWMGWQIPIITEGNHSSSRIRNIYNKNMTAGLGHFDFIEIGTCDYHTLLQRWGDTKKGISVEPIKIYLDLLPNKPNVIKVNAAISSEDDEIDLFYITPENQIKHNKKWTRGWGSVGRPHKGYNNPQKLLDSGILTKSKIKTFFID